MSQNQNRLLRYEHQLFEFLHQQLGSKPIAHAVTQDTLKTMQACEVLQYIGNPYEYINGYALALAKRRLQQAENNEA